MRKEYMLIELGVVSRNTLRPSSSVRTHPVRVSYGCLTSMLCVRTMATLRPNWFLISPVLMDSGACSWMSWYRCLIPMLAAFKSVLAVVLKCRRAQLCLVAVVERLDVEK
jgi:hypothetical protein